MKLVQIIYSGFGGLGSVAFSMVEADVERQHQWLIGFIGDLPIAAAYPQRSDANGVRWKEFRSGAGGPFKAWFRLGEWLFRENPHGIILHSLNSIIPCCIYAWSRKIPLIAVEHTPNEVKTRAEWIFSKLAMLMSDRVVLLTAQYRDELAIVHGRRFRPEKVSIIPNGIDTACFRPSINRGEDGKLRLGMAARFSSSKRQDLLVNTIRILIQRRPDIQWVLSLAGDGERLNSIKSLVATLGLENVVRLEMVLDESSISRWLQGLCIYVHASDGETLSTSLLQAMATGLPIVASDIPGIRYLLGNEAKLGVLVPNDPEKFADAIGTLVDDVSRRKRLACRAREEVVAKYNSIRMMESYLQLLSIVR